MSREVPGRFRERRLVPFRLIHPHEKRSGHGGRHGRAPGLGFAQLDVIRIVPPDYVVERIVLGQACIGKTVRADAAGVDKANEFRPDPPAGKQEPAAPDLLPDRCYICVQRRGSAL